jgi:cell wall-associated NlpC family hydrolase
MTASSMSLPDRVLRPGRRAVFALVASAGVVLTPVPALVAAPPAAAAEASAESSTAPSQAAQTAVDTAMDQRGKPYEWGGAGPDSYDCSGLTQYAYRAAGIELPHSSRQQSTMGEAVARADLRPGDLVFFYDPVGHVGIYIGDGQMVHAPTSGDVVKVSDVDDMPEYHSARRVA